MIRRATRQTAEGKERVEYRTRFIKSGLVVRLYVTGWKPDGTIIRKYRDFSDLSHFDYVQKKVDLLTANGFVFK